MSDSTQIIGTTGTDFTPELFNPMTGEIVSLDAPTPDIARLIADIRELESRLREAKALAGREILNRMDKQASWTLRGDDWEVVGESPAAGVDKEWDGEGLWEWLVSLEEGGELDIEAVKAAVEVVETFNVKQAGVNALRKAGFNGVDQFCVQVPRERRLKKVKIV